VLFEQLGPYAHSPTWEMFRQKIRICPRTERDLGTRLSGPLPKILGGGNLPPYAHFSGAYFQLSAHTYPSAPSLFADRASAVRVKMQLPPPLSPPLLSHAKNI